MINWLTDTDLGKMCATFFLSMLPVGELRAAITSHQVGDSVEIQIVRNGDKMTLNAVLEAIPEE